MSFQAISRQFGGEVQCKKSAWPDLTFWWCKLALSWALQRWWWCLLSAVYKEHNGARGPTRTQAQCVMLVITMSTNGAPEWGDTHCQGLTSLGQTWGLAMLTSMSTLPHSEWPRNWPHLTPDTSQWGLTWHLARALLPHSPLLVSALCWVKDTCKWRPASGEKKTDNFKHFQAVTFQSPPLNLTFGHFKNNIHKVFDFLEWSFLMVKHKIIIRI